MTIFASDLDGTLLNNDPSITDFSRNTLMRAAAAEHHIVLATGRPPRLVRAFRDLAPTVTHAVCANGAFVVDLADGTVRQLGIIPATETLNIVKRVRAQYASATFAVETLTGHRREWTYDSPYDVHDRFKGVIEDIVEGGVGKLLIRTDQSVTNDTALHLQEAVADQGVVTVSNPTFYEVAPPGINKATGVQSLGLAGDTIAYGDMPNDIPLLEWATVGIAVANADSEVLAAADHVLTRTNDEDAVAHHILSIIEQTHFDDSQLT